MKNIYLVLLSAFLLISWGNLRSQNFKAMEISPLPNEASKSEIGYSISNTNKAPGDTLWYEDFGNGLATNGWTTGNQFPWIYTTNAPGGQYSTSIPALISATSANGFVSLPSDLYNTPTPAGGFFPISSTLTSGPINISPKNSVSLKWTQSQRYCCSSTDQLELQVSIDGINWASFDAKFGRQANTAVVENAEINISAVAAGQSTIYLRFFQTSSHYYWMIDDIAIVESGSAGSPQLEVSESYFLDQLNFQTYYSSYPCFNPPSFIPGGIITNLANSNATNVRLAAAIVSGGNTIYTGSSLVNGAIAPFQSSTFQMTQPYNSVGMVGDYEVLFKGTSDSSIANSASKNITFSVSDSVFARDFNNPTSIVGLNNYVGGSSPGSNLGVFYELKNSGSISSISFYVANNPDNVGTTVKAKLFPIDTNLLSLGTAIASSVNYTIASSDLGSWVSLSIGQSNQVVLPAVYVAAVEFVSRTNSNASLILGRDVSAEVFAPFNFGFVSSVFVSSTSNFGLINALPMIRLNFKTSNNCIVGVEEQDKSNQSYSIFPNPSNGLVNMNLMNGHSIQQIDVYSIKGQLMATKVVSNKDNLLSIDLCNLPKGIYFLRFMSDDEIVTEKIVIE